MRRMIIAKSITQREYKSLDKYFNEIDKIDLITTNEEIMLAQKIREGDQAALERLTKTNLRFVVSVAKQYQNRGLTLGDLINEGNIGLMTAAKRYDETKGFKFISYAVWWIRQSIIAAVAERARMIHIPCNQLALISKLYKAFAQLEQEYGRKPSIDELAESLGISPEKVSGLINNSGINVSIDAPFEHDTEHTLLDVLQNCGPGADDSVMHESIKTEVEHSLRILSKRERELVVMFFGLGAADPLSLEGIGKKLNITAEHARRLKDNALIRLRNCSNASVLTSCLS